MTNLMVHAIRNGDVNSGFHLSFDKKVSIEADGPLGGASLHIYSNGLVGGSHIYLTDSRLIVTVGEDSK